MMIQIIKDVPIKIKLNHIESIMIMTDRDLSNNYIKIIKIIMISGSSFIIQLNKMYNNLLLELEIKVYNKNTLDIIKYKNILSDITINKIYQDIIHCIDKQIDNDSIYFKTEIKNIIHI